MTAVGITWRQGGGLATSLRSDWATPRKIFEMLDREFHFDLDACATKETACVPRFFLQGALFRYWDRYGNTIWVNPPYGKELGAWVAKGPEVAAKGATVVMLLPARTDTKWFFQYILNKAEIRFIQGRLCFDDNPRKRAPFPSMIVVFRPK